MRRRALVVTVVHHPLDARIHRRQVAALLQDGWSVTYAAPWTAYGLDPHDHESAALTLVDLPRARAARRLRAIRAAGGAIRRLAGEHDVVVVHDPELVLAARASRRPVVWDVHEDTAAAVEVRSWIPGWLRAPAAWAVRRVELWAERRYHLLLADHEYARRFRGRHPVVPNGTEVPSLPAPGPLPVAGRYRVVYLGSVTMERGAQEMVAVAARLRDTVRVEIIGPAHGAARAVLEEAVGQGLVDWHGFVPSERATTLLDGALAGLCLLHDEANFRPSLSTKVVDYLARGVPAVATPLPSQRVLLDESGGGRIVGFSDVDAVVDVLQEWIADPARARAAGARGHRYVQEHHNWTRQARSFVADLRKIADGRD